MTREKNLRLKKWCKRAGTVLLSGIGLLCVIWRLVTASSGIEPALAIAAAEMTLPTGQTAFHAAEKVSAASEPSAQESSAQASSAQPPASKPAESAVSNKKPSVPVMAEVSAYPKQPSDACPSNTSAAFEPSSASEEEIAAYEREHEGEERYPVYETTITEGNCSYQNVQVRNTASIDIDIAEELKGQLGFSIEQTDQPQVLIYHTHTSESYLPYDTGYFFESFFSRSTDCTENVCAVGEEIAQQLNAAGIVTIHDTTLHDYPSYSGAYDRSLATVEDILEKYPSIQVTLDIHRDGIGTDTEKTKPVFTLNGQKGAQMMILAGYNYDGCEEFRNWESNLRFALQIQKAAADWCPDMVRPLNFSDFMYNMNVTAGSLLIEVGAEANTLQEARYTGYCLGQILTQVLHPS